MFRIRKTGQEEIREKIRKGRIEGVPGRENFVDSIIKKMYVYHHGQREDGEANCYGVLLRIQEIRDFR